MNQNDHEHNQNLLYNSNGRYLFKARNGMTVRIIHYHADEGGGYLVQYENGQYLCLNHELCCLESRDFDIIAMCPSSTANTVSGEEIAEIISNYAVVTSPQKREQIRAVIARHAADYEQKPWFPEPKTGG